MHIVLYRLEWSVNIFRDIETSWRALFMTRLLQRVDLIVVADLIVLEGFDLKSFLEGMVYQADRATVPMPFESEATPGYGAVFGQAQRQH